MNDEIDVVEKCVGAFGRYHWFIATLIFLNKFPIVWNSVSIVLIAPPVEFRCSDPNVTDKCSCTTSFVYDKSVFKNTVISEWDLVCKKQVLQGVIQTVVMLGILVGSLLFGHLADKFGRRNTLVISVVGQVATGVVTCFVPWFNLFLFLKFLCCVFVGGIIGSGFVLLLELTGVKYRSKIAIYYQIPNVLGYLSLVLIGLVFRDWRQIQLAISVPSVILVSYICFIPESPKWHLSMGMREPAIRILTNIAKKNKLDTDHIPDTVDNYLRTYREVEKIGHVSELCKTRHLRTRTLLLSFIWMFIAMDFNGFYQYMGRISGNIFLNLAFPSAILLPGLFLLIVTLQKWSRKTNMFVYLVPGAAVLFLFIFIPQNIRWATLICGSCIIVTLSNAYSVIFIVSAELYPTSHRNMAFGFFYCLNCIGSIIAPYMCVMLDEISSYLTLGIFVATCALSALLFIWVPETKDCPLRNTIIEAENLPVMSTISIFEDRKDS